MEMTAAPPITVAVAVTEISQAGEARRVAVRLAANIGFDEGTRGEVAIIATELGTNLARYGRQGVLLMQALDLPTGPALDLLSIDRGPGIADLQAALQDGYSTGGTPGNGLGAVRRLSSDFDIFSTPDGTVVLARVRRRAPADPAGYDWGVISLPAPHETVCGDSWRIAQQDGGFAVMVADGLGHGPLAAEASGLAANVFAQHPFEDAAALIERAHPALKGSRGAAMAIATIGGTKVRYAGAGNIAGVLLGGERVRGLPSQNGTVGAQIRRVQALDYDWPARGRLIMHSDGLTTRWTLDAYPGLAARHPSIVAAVLWRDCARGRDDATIVVVVRKAAGPGHA
ncbi:MAG: ATP-binding SpoIIE family protein phosphatase [Vicinamibacteraceae bacterium]